MTTLGHRLCIPPVLVALRQRWVVVTSSPVCIVALIAVIVVERFIHTYLFVGRNCALDRVVTSA